jgi:hypothetical protein
MIETRKRSGRRSMKTVAVFFAFGLLGTAYGCSSDPPPDEGTGAACGQSINNPGDYPQCPCAGSRCVPKNLVTTGVVGLLTPCDNGNGACVPENIVAQGENLQLKKCSSIGGGEGRCASTCIGALAGLASYLPQDTCAANERCAPCFNPANGAETGICGLGCDQKATSAPVTFGKCCGNDGLCAPKAALPAALAGALGAESCTNASTDLCVPAKPVATPGAKFACCTITPAGGGAPIQGACVSACVIDAGPVGPQLPQGSCGGGEKCVPCANPIDGTLTGVCTDTAGQPASACQ